MYKVKLERSQEEVNVYQSNVVSVDVLSDRETDGVAAATSMESKSLLEEKVESLEDKVNMLLNEVQQHLNETKQMSCISCDRT